NSLTHHIGIALLTRPAIRTAQITGCRTNPPASIKPCVWKPTSSPTLLEEKPTPTNRSDEGNCVLSASARWLPSPPSRRALAPLRRGGGWERPGIGWDSHEARCPFGKRPTNCQAGCEPNDSPITQPRSI